MSAMSTQYAEQRIPPLTLGWRLRMALGDMTAQEMADLLGVSRQTLTRWMHDKGAPPRRAFVQQWALVTGVPTSWLQTGEAPEGEPDPGGELEPALTALHEVPTEPYLTGTAHRFEARDACILPLAC